MRANGVSGNMMYTNKTAKHTGNIRRVKCYLAGSDAGLVSALRTAAGAMNVNVTQGSSYSRSWGEGVTVKCVLE
jgi:hypothetical protein